MEPEKHTLIENPVDHDEWSICCSKSDANAIKYLVQVAMACIVMVFSMYCIVTSTEQEDKSIFWSLLSSTLTYFLDAPQLTSAKQS